MKQLQTCKELQQVFNLIIQLVHTIRYPQLPDLNQLVDSLQFYWEVTDQFNSWEAYHSDRTSKTSEESKISHISEISIKSKDSHLSNISEKSKSSYISNKSKESESTIKSDTSKESKNWRKRKICLL